jgi:hypothetical protein
MRSGQVSKPSTKQTTKPSLRKLDSKLITPTGISTLHATARRGSPHNKGESPERGRDTYTQVCGPKERSTPTRTGPTRGQVRARGQVWCKRTGPTALERHLTVQKGRSNNIHQQTLKKKLPANTEKLRSETDNKREAAPTRGEVVTEVAATRRERRE